MWSRKPTPVSRVPPPWPSRASASCTSVSRVARWMSAVRRIGPPILANLHGRCVTGKPSARAIGAPAAASAPAAAPTWTSLIRRRNVRADSPEAKRAAPPVGSEWFEPAT